jgi:hypothetical protein
VLTDRERTLLAPHLALLRAAQRELAAAQRAFDDASRQADSSTMGTDWRDRLLGGLLSVDESRARRYRQARGARKAASEGLAAATARYTKYAERMDGLLEPILTREDPAYRTTLVAVRACAKALHDCEEVRFRLASALTKPARNPKSDREPETWHEAEFARQRFAELVTELHSSIPALSRTIDRAARALGAATGAAPPALPTLHSTAALGRGHLAAENHLRGLQRELDAAIKELTRWHTRADEARIAVLRAAPDAL